MKRATVVGLVVAGVLVLGVGTAVAVSVGGGADAGPDAAPVTTSPSVHGDDAGEQPEASAEPTTDAEPTSEPSDIETDADATAGAYVDYSPDALAAADGTRVLFFHAPWCPQCRALESDIVAAGVPDGVTVLKVDYDSNQELREQYGVTLQTTVVALDDAGEATAVFVAYDEPTLAASLTGLGLG